MHMFSTLFTRAFRKPRELTWVSGCVLLLLTFAFGFTGYLLPWNELSFFATKVGTDIAGDVPVVGQAIKTVLRGGDDVTGATLSRFYAIHIAIIPAIFSAMLGFHLLLVQRQGMHDPQTTSGIPVGRKRMMPFFPNFLLRDILLWLVVLNVLLFLAVFFPWELGEKADAFAPAPEGIRPEWYFMFMFQALKILPAHVLFIEGEVLGIVGFSIAGLVWVLLPFLPIRDTAGKRVGLVNVIGVATIAFIVVMTIWGYLV